MSATSITEEKKSEELVDDISNVEVKQTEEVDNNKLAALKAKNQAKQQESRMASKIVQKKERSLSLGVIGSGQAGCIAGSTQIYLSKYGFISIEDFFYKMLNSANVDNIHTTADNQNFITLDDQEIFTVSIDPETGNTVKGKVKAVWKHKTSPKFDIKMSNGSLLTCSKKHPTLAFRPNQNKKAQFLSLSSKQPLSEKDRVFDSRLENLDLISQTTYIKGIEITEDLAWLIGVFVGDGHNKLNSNEISFCSDNEQLTDKIVRIGNQVPHVSCKVFDRSGCKGIAFSGLQARIFFDSVFEFTSNKTVGGFGNKTYTVEIPSCISSAPSNIRAAFLAGLIDSDGTVAKNWFETSIFTVSSKLADQVGCLISTLGGRSVVRKVESKKENESDGFDISISGKLNHGPMLDTIIRNIAHSIKKERLIEFAQKEQHSFSTSIIPIEFEEIHEWMKEGGMKNINNLSVQADVSIKNWSNGTKKLSISSFDKVMNALDDTEQVNYLKKIAPKLLEIESITESGSCQFFDLTIETYENYLAGNNGLIFTHNSRLAESFYKTGYDACVINTAIQDLKFIDIPDSNKLLLQYGLGGAAKEIEIGKEAAEQYRGEITQLVNDKLGNAQVNLLCLSLGGGSGAGSCETLVDILSETGKPLVVITVLPMDTEDAQTKFNALQTLSKLAKLTQTKKVNNLIVVDNAKIEAIYHNVGQMEFYGVANKAIVEPIDIFNTLSSMPSSVKGLDPMEFGKLFTDGEGLTVYGELTVQDFEQDTAIAAAVVNNLDGNLLAGGFDLKQSKYVGVIIAANKEVWSKIPSSSITYAMEMVNEQCGMPKGVFKGIYTIDTPEPVVKVYSMFTGLGLPDSRVSQLKKETENHSQTLKGKEDKRNVNLTLDTGTNETVSAAQKIKEKIAAKSSAFGKLVGGVVDRRK